MDLETGRFSWSIGRRGQKSQRRRVRVGAGFREGNLWGWTNLRYARSPTAPFWTSHLQDCAVMRLWAFTSKLVVTGYSSRRNWSTGPHLRNPQLDRLKAGSQVIHLSIPSCPPWDSQELWCRWSPLLLFSYSAMSDSSWPHGLQRARPRCPSPSSGVCPGSCPLNWWCYPTILSSTALFSFCLQSFPASGSFPMSQLSR